MYLHNRWCHQGLNICIIGKLEYLWNKKRYLKKENAILLYFEKALNPLTPVLPVTGCAKYWPFFHFWCCHFWPKLALSILKFCRTKRSLQWCPDQSDWLNGAVDMHKNAQKVEWKTHSKISCHYTWLLHGKSCPSRWHFLRSFLTASKPIRRSIAAVKRKAKEKKERRKKFQKSKSLET